MGQLEFTDFYRASRDVCLRAVLAGVGDGQLAEDLVAEAYTRAWMSWQKVSRHPAPRAWIVRTALNARVSWWRPRHREVALDGGHDAADTTAADPGLDPGLLAALRRLPQRQREVIAFRVFLDLDTGAVLDALKASLDEVTMHTPVEQIVAAGRARRRRRRLVGMTAGVAAAAGLALGLPTYGHPPPAASTGTGTGIVRVQTAAFTVERHRDGTVHLTWSKQRYVQDPAGLQAALRKAGFPALIKVGEFCKGPNDDGYLDPSGEGRGVDRVMKAHRRADGTVVFVFTPSAMPAGTELFIGYLSPSQLALTHGRPGSVERLVSTGVPLTCTTEPPPQRSQRVGPVPHGG